jgi:choline transporter-like protein 2/4/5
MQNWQWLLLALAFAIVVSFLFMFTLRCFAGLIVWTSLILVVLVFVGLGIIFLYNGGQLSSVSSYIGNLGIPTLTASSYYSVYGYISFGIAGLLLIIVLCCCSRIRLAVAICNVAGQFVSRVCQIIIVPIFMGLLIVGFWASALTVIVFLIASTKYVAVTGSVFTSIADFADSNLARMYYFFFATLWTNSLLQAMTIFIIASACCMWYYSHGPGIELNSPVIKSTYMIFRYHFGSLAFGSFILAIIQFLQAIVELFKQQA